MSDSDGHMSEAYCSTIRCARKQALQQDISTHARARAGWELTQSHGMGGGLQATARRSCSGSDAKSVSCTCEQTCPLSAAPPKHLATSDAGIAHVTTDERARHELHGWTGDRGSCMLSQVRRPHSCARRRACFRRNDLEAYRDKNGRANGQGAHRVQRGAQANACGGRARREGIPSN